jgi:hypothetical protein
MKKIFLLLLLAIPTPAAKSEANQIVWKAWYLYTVAGTPQGYFEEILEKRPGDKHLALTQRWVEFDGGREETYIGSVALDNANLSPVAFFSERKGPRVYKIDGRAKGGQLNMTFKPIKPAGKNTKKTVMLGPNVLLSNFVPLKLSRHEASAGTLNFSAVVEDAKDGNFDLRTGSAEVFGVTKEIKGATCRKSIVEFEGVAGEWWVTKEGKLCELSLPASKSKLELTTESEAKKAFGK